jgi:hypothetical protein
MTTYSSPIDLLPVGILPIHYRAALIYRASDPFTVEIAFDDPDRSGETAVLIDRAHLKAGLTRRAGDAVVQVQPHTLDNWLVISVITMYGQCRFYADAVPVRRFLDHTDRLLDAAPLDMDALTERLLEVW